MRGLNYLPDSMTGLRRLSPSASVASSVAVALLLGACSYDFDAPFAGGEGGAATSGAGAGEPTTTTSTSGGGGSGPAGAQSGGGAPAEEDCGNGADDDEDGDVDCADSACAAVGFTCAPPAPEGFLGPVALIRGPADAVPGCAGGFPDEVLVGGIGELSVPPPACSACSCDPPAGATCSAVLDLFADGVCITSFGTVDVVPTGAGGCEDTADTVAVSAVRAGAPVVEGGACAPGGGEPTAGPATFGEGARLCASSAGGGCGGDACLPARSDPLEDTLCVHREGGGGCSAAGPYTIALEVYGGVDDTRACTACSCAEPTGVTCGGSTTLYRNNDGCSGPSTTVDHDGTCTAATDFQSIRSTLEPAGGACAPAGGEPEGTAAAVDLVTVCCLP